MSKLKTLADLMDLDAYKKDLKADLVVLKDTPTAIHWIELFEFKGGKRAAAVLLGAVDAKLEAELKAAGKSIKAGKCCRGGPDEVVIISGPKPGLVAALFKTLGLAWTVGAKDAGSGGIDDDTAQAVGKMIRQADKSTDEGVARTADKLTEMYESLQKKLGPVYDEARRLKLPTDKMVEAENRIEADLKQTSAEIAANAEALKKKILDYGELGRIMAEANATRRKALDEESERRRVQERVDQQNTGAADELTRTYETLQKKFGPVFDEAKRLGLSTDALTTAENEIEKELKKTSAEIVANAEALKKKVLGYGQTGKSLAEAIAAHKKQLDEELLRQREKQRQQDERDQQLLDGVGKKKPGPSAHPANPQPPTVSKKPKYVPLNVGTMSFKEKFAADMVTLEGGVQKEVTSFDRTRNGFSTFYTFSQGDDPGAYEIHIHRDAAGRYLSGQVKTGRLAKVVRGGEESIAARELATYGIPARETPP